MKRLLKTYCIAAALFFTIVLCASNSISVNSTYTQVTAAETTQFFNVNVDGWELIAVQASEAREFYSKPFQFTFLTSRIKTGVLSGPFKNDLHAWCGTRLKV